MKRIWLVVALLPFVADVGCATIFRGTNDEIRIESIPSKAEVYVDGSHRGKTPVKLTLARAKTHTIELKAPGHKDVVLETERNTSVGFVVLDIFGGVVWLAVDAVTGGWYDVHPEPLRVILSPIGESCATGDCTYLRSETKVEGVDAD